MNAKELIEMVSSGGLDGEFTARLAVKPEDIQAYRARIIRAAGCFAEKYDPKSKRDVALFSVGGRCEISGNHTDHNRGRVMCAGVNLDIIAVASKNDKPVINVKSEGFRENHVELARIKDPNAHMYSDAMIAGVARAFSDRGLSFGGFDACTHSVVDSGSGLSSSAAFEVMITEIINELYCSGTVDKAECARMARFAENVYFKKPCGLMDQMGCALGGFIYIDFESTDAPEVRKVDFSLDSVGLSLCIVSAGGNHSDLTDDYAAVPSEMRSVAGYFKQSALRDITPGDVLGSLDELREKFGDRAVMRAMHFFDENDRVERQYNALCRGDIASFLRGVSASGDSSYKYLQNVYTTKNPREQGLSLALYLTERFIGENGIKNAACRVHGGGFAGTILSFIPTSMCGEYKNYMDSSFGDGACRVLAVRPCGSVRLA